MLNKIQQQPSPQSTTLRQTFYLQIKHSHHTKIFQKIRQSLVQHEQNTELSQLITATETQKYITPQQWKLLVRLVRAGLTNAVVLVGNVVLEGVDLGWVCGHDGEEREGQGQGKGEEGMGMGWVREIRGDCGYYQWLLLVLASRRIVDVSFVSYYRMFNQLPNTPTQFRLLNTLKCLNLLLLTQKPLTTSCLLSQWPHLNLTHLLTHNTTSPNSEISKQCYTAISELSHQEDTHTLEEICGCFGGRRIVEVVRMGMMSVYGYVRALACQVFNNFGVVLRGREGEGVGVGEVQGVFWGLVGLVGYEKEKVSVRVQVSYMMVNYIQSCSLPELTKHISHGLIKSIKQLSEPQIHQHNNQILQNYHRLIEYLNGVCFKFQINSEQEQFCLERICWELRSQGVFRRDQEIL